MTLRKVLKRSAVVLLVLLVVLGIVAYRAIKSTGIIPREIYETDPPAMPELHRPAVLIFDKTNGYIHKDAIPAAEAMLRRISNKNGWDIFVTANGASHTTDFLRKFDVVVWNNVSGDVLTVPQREALKSWLQDGGGWVGLHGAGGDFSYDWAWYVETLIGAQFTGHTMSPQFQDADVLVPDSNAPIISHLPSPWRVQNEEWYAFDRNPREKGYEILLVMDEQSYTTRGESWMGMNDRMEAEHPIAWRHIYGKGRVFYSAIGHQAATYSIPEYEEFIGKGMLWSMGVERGSH